MTTLASAVLAGVAVLLGGNLPWVALLAPLNLRFFQVVPWAIIAMGIYLVMYWRYIGGRMGSQRNAHARREGGLTWAANSILPALVLHVGGDVWSLTRLWLTGRPEWELSLMNPGVVGETGVDAALFVAAAAVVILGGATVGLCRSLRRLTVGQPALDLDIAAPSP